MITQSNYGFYDVEYHNVIGTTDNEVGYVEEITAKNRKKFNCKSCMKSFKTEHSIR